MTEQKKIPTGKVRRAAKFLSTGARLGGNYLKHYTKKVITGEADESALHRTNAQDIFSSLSQLKGSVLKVAQMISMDKNALPAEYLFKFAEAHYQTPPLSFPLVVRTFRKSFGCSPLSFFETFTHQAVNAASIGQVHRAFKNGRDLAVKIQYPGVAQSVRSDLKMALPLARRLLKMNGEDLRQYMKEVEERLLEETDYQLELNHSIKLTQACASLQHIVFPRYYPQWSSKAVITMDWMEGYHLKEYLQLLPSQEARNRAGQALWDFYQFQIHQLHQLHADPHPGNFLFLDDGKVGVIDFGCVKRLPTEFYHAYFQLHNLDIINQPAKKEALFYQLGFLHAEDSKKEKCYFTGVFTDSLTLLGKPFFEGTFDFGDKGYFKDIYKLGETLSRSPEFRNSKYGRGSRHGLYLNRTYFGLYNLLHHLRAKVNTNSNIPSFA